METIQQTEFEELTDPVFFTDGKETYVYLPRKTVLGGAELALEYLSFKQQSMVSKTSPKSFATIVDSGLANFQTGCISYLVRKQISEGNYAPFNADEVEKVMKFFQNCDDEEIEGKIQLCLRDFFGKRKHSLTYLNVLPKDLITAEKRMSLLQLMSNMNNTSNGLGNSLSNASASRESLSKVNSKGGSRQGKISRI